MKKLQMGILSVFLAFCLLLSGCGKVEVYKTLHESGTYKMDNFTGILFETKASPEKVAKKVPDFSVCEQTNDAGVVYEYEAKFDVEWSDETFHCDMKFNADNELSSLKLTHDDVESEHAMEDSLLEIWYKICSDLEQAGAKTESKTDLYENTEKYKTPEHKSSYKGIDFTTGGDPYWVSTGEVKVNYDGSDYVIEMRDEYKGELGESKKDMTVTHEVEITIE